MAGSKVLLNYINSYIDDSQQDRLTALERDKNQQYDMRELQKYRLLDRTPERLVTDDTPRRNVQSMSRPLEMREYGNRSKLAPYLNEVCLQDRDKDPRGNETHPQMSKIPLYTLQKGQWIKNNLYKDLGLQQVTEQIQHLKVVENRKETDKRMKDYLKIFSDERVGAANSRQFNPLDLKSGNRLSLQQQDQEDSKSYPVKIGAPNRPVKRVDYTKVTQEDATTMVARTEPSHLEQVGDRSQLIRSNPVFDPVERSLQRGELFTNNKEEALDVLQILDQRNHNHRPINQSTSFANALIDESILDLQTQHSTMQRHANRGPIDTGRADSEHFDQKQLLDERRAVVKRYKELQTTKRDPQASQHDIIHINEKLSNAIAAVKKGMQNKTVRKNGKISSSDQDSDMSLIDRIKATVGIKPGNRSQKGDTRKLTKDDQSMRSTEHLQNPVNQRKQKGTKDMIVNPVAHQELSAQIDQVNLQYNALSEDGKSVVYRLSAVFVPPQVTPSIKLQIAEELIELVARNRIPRAQLQTVYNPHASEQDIEQLTVVIQQNMMPRLKQKLTDKDFRSAAEQIQQDHVKAFQQLQGITHASSAFAFFGRDALQNKKHAQHNPITDADRHQHITTQTSRNLHGSQDVGFMQRVLTGEGQIVYKEQFAGYQDPSNTQTNTLRSGGDKKRQRKCVQYDSIMQDSEKERTVGQ